MGKIAKLDEINFNYPIPRSLHKNVKRVSLEHGIPVKDIVINSLIMYINSMKQESGKTDWEKEL